MVGQLDCLRSIKGGILGAMISMFTSDLHGNTQRYEALLAMVQKESPEGLLLGGDLLPRGGGSFVRDYLLTAFGGLRDRMGSGYPRVLLVPGNDDPASLATDLFDEHDLWECIHRKRVMLGTHPVYGYACVPPTPFLLKDWERYDVSRFVDPGCVSPEEGHRTVDVNEADVRYGTIQKDLENLVGDEDLCDAIMLFHSPPYGTDLDRADLEGQSVDHVPLDPHVGSIAIRRFIETRQPLVTLHGHVHETVSLTGDWKDEIGRTTMFSGCSTRGLAVIRFDPDDPSGATREVIV